MTLRRQPNADKRIAFVLTNSGAKAARVGNAVGLDAPASLLRLLRQMQETGYDITGLPETSDDLLLNLIDRCSYDVTWLRDAQLAQAHKLPVERYEKWFAETPESNRRNMVRQWGDPPGKAYVHDDAYALPLQLRQHLGISTITLRAKVSLPNNALPHQVQRARKGWSFLHIPSKRCI